MAFMVWNQYLVTGIEAVDREHKGLVDLLNQVAPMLAHAESAGLDKLEPILDKLLGYAGSHFRTEEELMARLGMDERARSHHEASHACFVQDVLAMFEAARAGQEQGGDRLLSFLASWLVLHILGEDQSMARQVRALQAGASGLAAFEPERKRGISPSPEAMSHAMVDVYTVLTRQNRELWLANRALDASRAQVRHQNENLEAMVRARTAELEKLAGDLKLARDAAEAGSQAKSRFLGIVSHELRTPMNAVLGNARMLMAKGLAPPQEAVADRVVQAGDRLMALLNGILEYARLGAGGDVPVQPVRLPLAPWLADVVERDFRLAAEKGLKTALELAPDLPSFIEADGRLMGEVLRQFLANAVKFTQAGAIRVDAGCLAGSAEGRCTLRLSVRDTGIGIPEEVRSRLFQPFTQADDRPDRRFEGLGLGLSLAWEYARVLGGRVGMDSAPGRGSVFWLEMNLPAVFEPGAVPVPKAAQAPPVPVAPAVPFASAGLTPALRDELERLDGLLAACDTRAAACLDAFLPALRSAQGGSAELLGRRIAEFNYDEARVLIQAWTKEAKSTA